jgi:hypothetical protein
MKLSETARYLAMTFGLQFIARTPMPKAMKIPIQNVLIALMMIYAYARQEMITGKWLSTLVHKARKDAMSTSRCMSPNKSKRFEAK